MPAMTIIGWSLFFIALGAVLKWAITAHVHGINLHTTGVILMVVGVVGLCIGLFQVFRVGSSTDLDPNVS